MHQALNDMTKDKAPGLDGLTVEFYCNFWYLIKKDFVDLVEYCHKKGRLPDSINRALARLLFKNRGERSDLKIGDLSVFSMSTIKLYEKF